MEDSPMPYSSKWYPQNDMEMEIYYSSNPFWMKWVTLLYSPFSLWYKNYNRKTWVPWFQRASPAALRLHKKATYCNHVTTKMKLRELFLGSVVPFSRRQWSWVELVEPETKAEDVGSQLHHPFTSMGKTSEESPINSWAMRRKSFNWIISACHVCLSVLGFEDLEAKARSKDWVATNFSLSMTL